MQKTWNYRESRIVLTLICLGLIAGCSSGKKETNDSAPIPNAETAQPGENIAANNTPEIKPPSTNQPSKQKYVDGIPYDVFYDRPLQVAADNTLLAGNGTPDSNPESNTNPKTMQNPDPNPKPKPTEIASADSNWDKIISHELLQSEIKRIRNKLNSNLNSVGNFNRELLAIQIDAATLAAMAGIAGEHSGEFTWKEKAKYVRDFSSQIAMAAESRGRPAFEKAEKPFLNIIEILDGGSPAELPESEDKTVFSDVADRNLLMKNLKARQDWLRTTISNENDFKSNQEEVLAIAALLAAIGQVVNQEDYVFADEDDYQKFCKLLIEGSLLMKAGIRAEDFSQYTKGVDLFNSSCNKCHQAYISE